MDVKASARAKHASSQRGRARHSTRKHQPQQQQQQQQQQPVSGSQQPKDKKDSQLPSNWSRYEEEMEEEALHDDRVADVPPAKSKGANYKDLLAEKSMLQGPDLASGRKSLMVTRGLDLWSQLTDMDNMCEVSGEEDNFFTLDLDFLNKELSKIDIAERLLLDAEYAHHGEIRKSERGNKNPGIVTADGDSSIESALSSPWEFGGVDSSMSTGNEESGGGVNKTGATSKFSETYVADPSPSKEFEMLDGIMHSVSKEPLVPLPKTTPLFDAQSAEAELDALLDILDIQTVGQAPNVAPMEPLGSASAGSHPYVLQESGPQVSPADCSDGATTLFPNIGALNDSLRHMVGPTKLTGETSSVSLHVPIADPRKNVPNLDEDFDDWLDNL